ncbi:MAG: PHP domain-containing protein [Gammaproteobacteria bacterium]|nr:PHP domain-containing protein [Gammaproteobacteria bacterium]
MMKLDLHCHTTSSDGALTPNDIVQRARERGIDVLSITDHDTIDAYGEIDMQQLGGLRLVPGVELSTRWRGHTIHIVGLDIDLASDSLADAVSLQQRARAERAVEIGRRLERAGIADALDGARDLAGTSAIGRPHFARFLVESGRVKSITVAFKKYLGPGKAGDVKHFWPPLEIVTGWITAADGIAVLAHPGKYGMTNTKLAALVDEFRAYGGRAIEVLCGQQPADVTRKLARLCVQRDMLASCGSDFHAPGQPWSELGAFGALPTECRTIREALRL